MNVKRYVFGTLLGGESQDGFDYKNDWRSKYFDKPGVLLFDELPDGTELAFFYVYTDSSEYYFPFIHTSVIERMKEDENGIDLYTMNSFYSFEKNADCLTAPEKLEMIINLELDKVEE